MRLFPQILALLAVWSLPVSAQAEPTAATPSDTGRHIFVLTGQSNSLGAVKGTPATPELLAKYRSGAVMWNGNVQRDTGRNFEQNPTWQEVKPQSPIYNEGPCMGPEYGFCHMLERRAPERFKGKLGVIKTSQDGGGNSFWLPGAQSYKNIISTITKAMQAQQGGTIEGLLYLQGESDKGDEVTLAGKRFLELADNLRRDAKAPKMRLHVVGQPANWHGKDTEVNDTTTAKELEAMVKKNKVTAGWGQHIRRAVRAGETNDYAWVRTRDLTKITRGDNMGVHYDGKSQITIGARMAYGILCQLDLPIPAVRNDNPDTALDDPNAAWWWTGKAARVTAPKKVAVWDVASYTGESRIDKEFVTGSIRIEDPFCPEVVIRGKNKSVLQVGGIELQEADLKIANTTLRMGGQPKWRIPGGRTLTLENVTLGPKGAGKITLEGKGTLRIIGRGTNTGFRSKGEVTIEKQ